MKNIIYLIAFLFLVGCENANDKEFNTVVDLKQKSQYLILDFPEEDKWVVNKETTIGMNKIKELVFSFDANEKENYRSFSENIKSEIFVIFDKCDLEDSIEHDKLHDYLQPFFKLVELVGESKTTEEGEENIEELKYYVANYFMIFTS